MEFVGGIRLEIARNENKTQEEFKNAFQAMLKCLQEVEGSSISADGEYIVIEADNIEAFGKFTEAIEDAFMMHQVLSQLCAPRDV